jgi:hypothetical protein
LVLLRQFFSIFSGLRSKAVSLFSIGSLCMVYNNSPQYKQ